MPSGKNLRVQVLGAVSGRGFLQRQAVSRSRSGRTNARSRTSRPAVPPILSGGGSPDDQFEVVPSTIRLPLKLVLDETAAKSRVVRTLRTTGAVSTSATMEAVRQTGEEILRRHRERFIRGDGEAVFDLLRIDPVFLRVPWVREALDELERAAYFARPRGRGRPRGATVDGRLVKSVIVALVDDRVARTGRSRERVFYELADRRFENLERDTIKLYYYSTRRDPRYAAFLVADEAKMRIETRREIEDRLRVMGVLPDGQ